MNFIYLLIIIKFSYSLKYKFCNECKYFLNSNNNNNNEYAKCSFFERPESIEEKIKKDNQLIKFLVTKQNKPLLDSIPDYYYCSTARSIESMCGIDAKYFDL